mmetsp:Transcript_3110/g.5474  ORF Transcript_3110/g.5474 Transcript_3110/m.5474 type:complete len:242 (+) Transcript_3110:1229-1954(+)
MLVELMTSAAFNKMLANNAAPIASSTIVIRLKLCSLSKTRTRSFNSPSSIFRSVFATYAILRGCVTTDSISSARHPSRFCTDFTAESVAEPSFKSINSFKYGRAIRVKSYDESNDFPIPSSVVNARKTKVKVAGNLNGASSVSDNKSEPIVDSRLCMIFFVASFLSASGSFAKSSEALKRNVSRKNFATFSTETRSTFFRNTPIFSSASHTSRLEPSYTPKINSTRPRFTSGLISAIIPKS